MLMFLPVLEDWTEVTRRHCMLHSHSEEKDVLEQCVPAHRYITLVSFPTSAQVYLVPSPQIFIFLKKFFPPQIFSFYFLS